MIARLGVVIPAHQEGALIRATLERMLGGAEPGEFEVVVVANGCTDDTAAQARRVPGVTVVEIERASKIDALNAGDSHAAVFPRVYLDADVEVDAAALRATADALDAVDAPRVAAPVVRVDTSASSLPVRCHARIWALSDYRRHGHVGSGLYAVNEAGRSRWGRFPDVIADDRFVQNRFSTAERITVGGAVFTVHAPATMRALLRRGLRIERGNRQLPGSRSGGGAGHLLAEVARRPGLWADFPFYAWGYLVPRLRARWTAPATAVSWNRDASLRESARV